MRPSCRPFLCIGHLDNKASGEDVLFFKSIKMIDHADVFEIRRARTPCKLFELWKC
ncbi:hypothetical protein FAM18124_00284 [Lacticaseibacillus paracasei]|nr:hypothetical protein FAM18124_00284 [Lacticaseibacillus paracasei]RND73483.1 hypothetical protein FAM18129_00339 [Lacticaseibacillus paracasei]